MIAFVRQLGTGLRTLAVLTVILGIVYPMLVWGIGRADSPTAAYGSLLVRDGQVVGSSLIGQQFEGELWFRARPSASDYDALASGASNLGPSDPDLLAEIAAPARGAVAERESVREIRSHPTLSPPAPRARPVHLPGVCGPPGPTGRRGPRRARRTPWRLVAAHTRSRSLGFLGSRE